jgi:hypothetical protein
MKKLLILFEGILVLASCSNESVVAEEAAVAAEETAETTTDSGLFSREGVKVSVCHKNGGEIVIAEAALNTHIAHGDAVDRDGDGFYNKVNPCSETDCDDYAYEQYNSCEPPSKIGDQYKGGLVFYFLVEGDTGYFVGVTDGLVCYTQDAPTKLNWDDANDYCANFGPINDWRLPSKIELDAMYVNKVTLEAVPGFEAFEFDDVSTYWSSTEYDNDYAWVQNFSDGNQGGISKNYTSNVRAVRAF